MGAKFLMGANKYKSLLEKISPNEFPTTLLNFLTIKFEIFKSTYIHIHIHLVEVIDLTEV